MRPLWARGVPFQSAARHTLFAAAVRSVRDEHRAGVLLIDHNMALIMDVCDRIVVLDQGLVLAEGTPAEIPPHHHSAAAAPAQPAGPAAP